MLARKHNSGLGAGLGVIWEPGNTWADYLCLLPGSGYMSMCEPAQTMTQVRNAGRLDCTQAGWRGREAECEAANKADDAEFLRIMERESATNPDLYREWYEASGGQPNNPDAPPPQFHIPAWGWIAGAGLIALWAFARSR